MLHCPHPSVILPFWVSVFDSKMETMIYLVSDLFPRESLPCLWTCEAGLILAVL